MTAAGKCSDGGPGGRLAARGAHPGGQAAVRSRVEVTDPISHEEIELVLSGHHHDPHSVLGAHPGLGGTVIRTLRPLAWSVDVVLPDGSRYPMAHVHEGVFSVTVPAGPAPASDRSAGAGQHGPGASVPLVSEYRLAVSYRPHAPDLLVEDPRRHLPTPGEMDLHLIGEGRP